MIKYKRRPEIKKLIKEYLKHTEWTLYDLYTNPYLDFEDLPEEFQEIISAILEEESHSNPEPN